MKPTSSGEVDTPRGAHDARDAEPPDGVAPRPEEPPQRVHDPASVGGLRPECTGTWPSIRLP